MNITLDTIETLLKWMGQHRIDRIKLGDIELNKTRHDSQPKEGQAQEVTFPSADSDEILFYSTSAPSLTAERMQEVAASMPDLAKTIKPKKVKKDVNAK